MRQGSILLALMATGLTFFVSCGPRGQSTSSSPQAPSNSQDRSTPQAGTPSPSTAQGTADSGGGNTFQGKPLESYKVQVQELDAYKKFIVPIVNSESLKGTRIGNAIKSIVENKIWYLIPSELKQLPSEKIGSAVGSEQAALQDFKQVWINSLIFEKMKNSEQATLIVHEIMMGLKLLKMDSARNECTAHKGMPSDDLQDCYNQLDKPRGKPSDLTESDYAQVRNSTALIIEKGLKLSYSAWEELLGSQGIIEISLKKMISLSDLSQMIESSKIMKTWPTFGFNLEKFYSENLDILTSQPEKLNGIKLESDQRCEFDLKIVDNSISLMVSENNIIKTYSSPWTASVEMHLNKDPFSNLSLYSVGIPTLKLNGTANKGDEIASIELRFLGQLLLGFEVRKAACLNEECSKTGQGLQGYFLSCYTKPSVQLRITN